MKRGDRSKNKAKGDQSKNNFKGDRSKNIKSGDLSKNSWFSAGSNDTAFIKPLNICFSDPKI